MRQVGHLRRGRRCYALRPPPRSAWPRTTRTRACIAERLAAAARACSLDLATVQTNIVVFHLRPTRPTDAPTVVERARERGVLVFAFGPRTVRAVTHLDVSREQCAQAAELLRAAIEE